MEPGASQPKTVMVATAVADVRERFTVALHAAGHHVVEVAKDDEQLSRVTARVADVDLVALDLRLGGAGVGGATTLRSLDPPVPLIIFSGSVDSAQDVRALARVGVVSFINEHSAVNHILPSLAPLLFPDSFNRRTSKRIVLDIAVSYRFADSIAAALTLNLSKGGLGVRTMTPLEPGTKVGVRFRLPGSQRDLEAASRVTWSDHRSGMGLQFEDVDTSDQTAIDEFVDQHMLVQPSASPYDPRPSV